MHALLDGDIIAYQACAKTQTVVELDGETLCFPHVDEAIREAAKMVHDWTKAARCNRTILCWSDTANFRKIIYPEYKANRKDKPKPEGLSDVREALNREHRAVTMPGLEADDVLGILGTSMRDPTVIVTIDKDLQGVPGIHFNPSKDMRPRRINAHNAERWWQMQTMMGDPTDGIPGIHKVGPVAAEKIIDDPRLLIPTVKTTKTGKNAGKTKTVWEVGAPCSVWEAMVSRAAKAGMSEEDLVTQARLTRILRFDEYDQSTNTIKLWSPNGSYRELCVPR